MPQLTSSWARTAACCALACIAGIGTSVGVASGKDGADDTTGTTTGETTNGTTTDGTTTGTTTDDSTTDRTTTDRTTTDGSTTDRTTTAPYVGPPRAPRILELEADWRANGKIRLRTELARRGAAIGSVRFRYRGKGFKAKKVGRHEWAKSVRPRGGDSRGDVITFRVRACAAKRCNVRTGSDEAGG
ncbi:MAG TPA: hypothetical protein VHF88_03445 [Thermoleophilaceae bacterium]|nr:hypothetical protein [Thermoleophilaceae bacterium]